MIEKITPDHILGLDGLPTTIMPDSAKLMRKINELVDAVNELQTRAENVQPDAESRPENVQDKFAEHRRWIGKLCRFRDEHYEPDCWEYGVLEDIEDVDTAIASTFRSSDGYWYDFCEPVKPNDSIIYKGGDNE